MRDACPRPNAREGSANTECREVQPVSGLGVAQEDANSPTGPFAVRVLSVQCPSVVLMLIVAIAAALAAGVSALFAWRSAAHAKRSVAEATRSADAAETAAGAAMITAQADRAEDHRKRAPKLAVVVEELVEHDGDAVIYRVRNNGPADLDSVVVHRPVMGDVEGRIRYDVAATTRTGWDSTAEIGPILVAEYGRFTLALGHGATLPEFVVKIISRAGDDEPWVTTETLAHPRRDPPPPPPQALPPSPLEPSAYDLEF